MADTPEQAAFRQRARHWLQANARPFTATGRGRGRSQEESLERARAWQRKLYDAGWSCLRWPKAYGGQGASAAAEMIWKQEVANYDEPDGFFAIGLGDCAPALMAYADEEQKRQHLPRMARAEEIWCQLYSEPEAGSDLAGLRTRAVRDGEGWRVQGHKIWTSGAHYSDYGLLLCRTDPSLPKHQGLTQFFMDMHQPGVEVRPIRQMDGGRHFNEVFLQDAWIPDGQRLGEVGEGWKVARTVLLNERMSIGGVQPTGFAELLHWLQTEDRQALGDPLVRERLAAWYVRDAGLRHLHARMLDAVAHEGVPGAEGAITKLAGATMFQEIQSWALEWMGRDGLSAEGSESFLRGFLGSPALRVAGGTDEIMRNILAEQVLGLPREPRLDKGIPFDQIPSADRPS